MVESGLERVSEDYKTEGKEKFFRELEFFLPAALIRCRLTPIWRRDWACRERPSAPCHPARARYRGVLRAEVRRTVDTDAEVDGELHELFRVLTGN